MATKKSESNRYESRYGGNYISPAQFIAELMCERIGKKNGQDLAVCFWKLPAWKKQFLLQVMHANSLLKLYSPKAIINALTNDKKAYSLKAPWLADSIQQEQDKIDATPIPKEIEVKPIELIVEKPREAFSANKSNMKKLRELDE